MLNRNKSKVHPHIVSSLLWWKSCIHPLHHHMPKGKVLFYLPAFKTRHFYFSESVLLKWSLKKLCHCLNSVKDVSIVGFALRLVFVWRRGEEFCGRNRTAGGSSMKQKKSFLAGKRRQPKEAPKLLLATMGRASWELRCLSCCLSWQYLGIKGFLVTLCLFFFHTLSAHCVFWLKYSAHSACLLMPFRSTEHTPGIC